MFAVLSTTATLHIMDERSAFQFKKQREHQKLSALGWHTFSPAALFHSEVTVLCGITGAIILDPYFFEEATLMDFATCSVNFLRSSITLFVTIKIAGFVY